MSDNSAIEWTKDTWNVASGCTKISEGCINCYIERTPPFRMNRRKFDAPGVGGKTGVILHHNRLETPLRQRVGRPIFVNSLTDLFHEDIPDDFIADVFAVMCLAPQHTFQLLTKRHGRMRSLLSAPEFQGYVSGRAVSMASDYGPTDPPRGNPANLGLWPLPNLWLGVSVESQRWANVRIPALLATPAAVRWISAEPLLGPLDLTWCNGVNALDKDWTAGTSAPHPFLDWVVAGGESGPGARPMHLDWVRTIRDQCNDAGVAFFFKQIGGRTSKTGGRDLDGRTWDEMPEAKMPARSAA